MSEFIKEQNIELTNFSKKLNYTLQIYSLKDISINIDFNKLQINNEGTILYDGLIYEQDEVKKCSSELIQDIEKNKTIHVNTILKKILLSFILIFFFSFLSAQDVEWIILACISGYFGQPGANIYDFFKEKFFKNYNTNVTIKMNILKKIQQ